MKIHEYEGGMCTHCGTRPDWPGARSDCPLGPFIRVERPKRQSAIEVPCRGCGAGVGAPCFWQKPSDQEFHKQRVIDAFGKVAA